MTGTTAALLATVFVLACGDPPAPQPPAACGTVEDIELDVRDRITVEPCFADPEMAALTLTTASSDSTVALPLLDGPNRVTVVGRSIGEATIAVTATDPDSLDVTVAFKASVLDYPLYLDDDFGEDSGEWSYDDGVLFQDDLVNVWSTGTDQATTWNWIVHEPDEETTNWRVTASAMFAHDSVLAILEVMTSTTSPNRYRGYGLLLGKQLYYDQNNSYPSDWAAIVYDVHGPWGEGWYIYEDDWFGEHGDIRTGSFVEIEMGGVGTGEVVFKANGEVLTAFPEEYATSNGIERIKMGVEAAFGYASMERCPDGVCVDVRFDWVRVRGLQGEDPDPHPRKPPVRPSTPPAWRIGR